MSIKRIVTAIEKPNLVPMVKRRDDGESELQAIGRQVCQAHENNESTMKDWTEIIEDGLDVAEFTTKSTSYPWDDAANFKSPLITQAVRQFADRAKMEIMKSDKLVACKIIGPPDPDKDQACERVADHMNFQINGELPNWRAEHTRLLYTLAAQGAVFKKVYYDSTEGHNESEIIKYPNFSIDQECNTLEDANFTHIKHYYPNHIYELVAAKLWDAETLEIGGDRDSEDADEQYEFLEQYTRYDIFNIGYEVPLIVTVHKNSQTPVRIVAQYDLDGVHVDYDGITYNLAALIKASTRPETENAQFNQTMAANKLEAIEKKSRIVRITPMRIITPYHFIESTDGSYLGIGYLHVMASTVNGINKSTNALLNAGELANLQGGWLSKEHRDRRNKQVRMKAGYWRQTNISAQALANSVYPLPFKEPSRTLLEMTAGIKEDAKELSAQLNFESMLSPNIPAASVLGLLQEGTLPTSSLLMNVINSMSLEFKIMYRLNIKYTEPLIYQNVTGTANYQDDYNLEMDVAPTANAQFSNQMQKIQLAQAQLEQLELLLQVGGNPAPIVRNYFEAIGTTNSDEIFDQEMSPEEQAQADEMRALQEQTLAAEQAKAEAIQFQNQLLQAQVQQAQQDVERRLMESQARIETMRQDNQLKQGKLELEAVELRAKIEQQRLQLQLDARELAANIQNMQDQNMINAAKVETDREKAQLDSYNKQLDSALKMASNMAKGMDTPPREIEIKAEPPKTNGVIQ